MTLARDVRGKTLRILEGIGEEQARFAAPGLVNSILWHAGHVYTVVERLAMQHLTASPPNYPAGWFETFGWNSSPGTVTNWPSLAEVRSRLVAQQEKVLAEIKSADDQKLAKIVNPERGWTIRYATLHAFHDEANHQGEMWLLMKMLAKM